ADTNRGKFKRTRQWYFVGPPGHGTGADLPTSSPPVVREKKFGYKYLTHANGTSLGTQIDPCEPTGTCSEIPRRIRGLVELGGIHGYSRIETIQNDPVYGRLILPKPHSTLLPLYRRYPDTQIPS
ncbi:10015_t:CDS:2, partial [Acaulospora colombiana]